MGYLYLLGTIRRQGDDLTVTGEVRVRWEFGSSEVEVKLFCEWGAVGIDGFTAQG